MLMTKVSTLKTDGLTMMINLNEYNDGTKNNPGGDADDGRHIVYERSYS